ncbi:apical endosomal glycoprotein-like [Homarus americanus]|uniref:apical endosomal glycoprotein-like n=1 Tax=Homarus americanus TaxID=6706 RepID=UPI001C45B57B|nr:apical endosomal glycoprotein-like [Homarus americanus]
MKVGQSVAVLLVEVIFLSLGQHTAARGIWKCGFEEEEPCGWVLSGAAEVRNARQVLDTSYTPDGYLLALVPPDTAGGDGSMMEGRFQSPVILPSRLCKVEVNYTVTGRSSVMRIVQVEAESGRVHRRRAIWGSEAKTSVRWSHKTVQLSSAVPFYVVMKGEVVEVGGSVMVDNVTLSQQCQPHPSPPYSRCGPDQYSCFFSQLCIPEFQVCDFTVDCPRGDDESSCGNTNFEIDLGGWYDAGYNDTTYVWSRVKAGDATHPFGTALDFDHTYANSTGHFMWADGSSSDHSPATAIQHSPEFGPVILPCTVVFWYQKSYDSPGIRINLNTEKKLWIWVEELLKTSSQDWKMFQHHIGEYNQKVYLELISNWDIEHDGTMPDVSVDDVEWRWCDPKTPPFEGDFTCNFNDPCLLFQSNNDTLDWVVTTDRAHPEEKFLITPDAEGTAIMQTWWYHPPTDLFCLSFSYMVERDTSLKVKLLTKDGGDELLWMRENQTGISVWRNQHIEVTTPVPIQIQFIGEQVDQRIRLDTVDMIEGNCPATFSCSFDDDSEVCDWDNYNDGTVMLSWYKGDGHEGDPNSPPVDHSWGTDEGHYIFLPIGRDQDGQKGYFKSPSITTTTPEGDCFQFWFYLFSYNNSAPLGQLGVRLLTTEVSDRIWEHTYSFRSGWQFGQVTIQNEQSFSIILEGLRGKGIEGAMAWDDLSVMRGKCEDPGSCTFEDGLCGYVDEDSLPGHYTPASWVWYQAVDGPDGLTYDHTLLTSNGHYIFADNSRCMAYESVCYANLDSVDISPLKKEYCFTAYINTLQIGGEYNGYELNIASGPTERNITSRTGHH